MILKEKDTIDFYLIRAKRYQSKLKQLDKEFDNDEFVEVICLSLPSKYNLTKQSLTALMASNQETSLDTVVHLLTKEEVRQKKQKATSSAKENAKNAKKAAKQDEVAYAVTRSGSSPSNENQNQNQQGSFA